MRGDTLREIGKLTGDRWACWQSSRESTLAAVDAVTPDEAAAAYAQAAGLTGTRLIVVGERARLRRFEIDTDAGRVRKRPLTAGQRDASDAMLSL